MIRIDPLGGGSDHHRWPVVGVGAGPDDAESYYWASLNKGKRSVAVDMRSDAGRELVTALIAAAGVLVGQRRRPPLDGQRRARRAAART